MTENTKKKKKKKKGLASWLVPGIVIAFLLVGAGFMLKIFLSPSSTRKKDKIQVVSLLKPPQPEPPKEKPPEPEMKKEIPKETMTAPTESPQQSQAQDQPDAPPAGADLGVEGEGGSGSDGFGLVAKGKGKGRDIMLGSGGGGGMSRMALLTKFGWYTSKIQEEVKRQMRKRMDQNGGMPKGKFQVTVKIQLDAKGAITGFKIVNPSGNEKMDEALKTSLPGFRISQPPPEGMPQGMTLRISSQG